MTPEKPRHAAPGRNARRAAQSLSPLGDAGVALAGRSVRGVSAAEGPVSRRWRVALAIAAGAGFLALGAGAWLLPGPASVPVAVGLAAWWCWHLERHPSTEGPVVFDPVPFDPVATQPAHAGRGVQPPRPGR